MKCAGCQRQLDIGDHCTEPGGEFMLSTYYGDEEDDD
jgi:hypothetical protein